MICEMCGKNVPFLKTVVVEGTRLQVCGSCTRFGTVAASDKQAVASSAIEARLEQRQRRYQEKDVFVGESLELAEDYPETIRSARQKKGWSQEELGKMLNEKRSVVAKLEAGDMRPDSKLVKKLEGLLGIKLMEAVANVQTTEKKAVKRGLTLGDLINLEKSKK